MQPDFLVNDGQILYTVVDLEVYPLAVLLKVAHKFTDRCYLHLQFEGESAVGVRFRGKKGADCTSVAGDFCNELIDQTLRLQVNQETEEVRNLILAHALSNTNLLHPELEIQDPREDAHAVGQPDPK